MQTETRHSLNTMLAAGVNVSLLNETHLLEGFECGSNVQPTSVCGVLKSLNPIVQ
jgi:hypothetical protein